MFKKIISIKNTGKFRSYTAKGDLLFRKMNLLYSENGRGKTTLSQIFRSLNDQDESLIIGRKTLGESGKQSIDLLTDAEPIKFKDGRWLNKPNFDIEIFDSSFVSKNVYSKNIIEHDQKKQLYLFTIGKQGVEYADKLFKTEENLKELNKTKRELEKDILNGVQGVLSVPDFVNLPNKENIDYEIQSQEKSLLVVEKENDIKNKANLSKLVLPSFDRSKFEGNISSKSINTLLDDAEQLTKQHIEQKLDHQGEKWIEYGVNKIHDEHCPFCNQDIKDVKIVNAFRSYFSEGYKKAIQSVDNLERAFNQKFNIDELFSLQETISSNVELLTFWKQYIDYRDNVAIDIGKINLTWERFTTGIKKVIETKKLNPLEPATLSVELGQIIDMYLSILDDISKYNKEVETVNNRIKNSKSTIGHIKSQDLKVKISRLKNIKLRYSETKVRIIDKYKSLLTSIESLNNAKKQIKSDLQSYTESIFTKYEERINFHLDRCGANFKISDYKSSFLGGKPSSNFSLTINNIDVQLGNEKSPLTSPSFKNTLSEGDKSSLAFAFFLASLEIDPDIGKKVIIFDDPISSLDNHRKNYTANQIMRFNNLAKQVFVLTHDSYFARLLWRKFSNKKSLLAQYCIKRDGISDSKIEPWNADEETRSEYYQSYFTLADFLEGKTTHNSREVARCIRPLLEGNLRIRFPRYFSQNEWLGNFIESLRETNSGPLLKMKQQLSELEEINDYSKKYHHDINPFADTESINDTELMAYVKRTLDVIRGVYNVVI